MHLAKTSRIALLGGACVAVLALAGCGGSSHAAGANTNTTTTVPGSSGNGGARLNAFRDCMSSHGITLPQRPRNGNGGGRPTGSTTPGSSRPRGGFGGGGGGGGAGFFNTPPPGVDPTKYQNAMNACRSTLPTGGNGNFRNSTAFNAYRSCLQDHGVKLPAQGATGATINRNDPKVQAAMKTCRPLLPTGAVGNTATTAPTTKS